MIAKSHTHPTHPTHRTFWVVSGHPRGTLMVRVDDAGQLGRVYLAKGLTEPIANLVFRGHGYLPAMVSATLLPFLDFLVTDGMMEPPNLVTTQPANLAAHVKMALASDTVITQGASSAVGLWDAPPTIPGTGAVREKTTAKSSPNVALTPKQKRLARDAIRAVKERGGQLSDASLIFRRLGYSAAENPNRLAFVMHSSGNIVDTLVFRGDLTYTLDEVLTQLKKVAMTRGGLTQRVLPDEISVVAPLQQALKEACEEAGMDVIKVIYYPPPSEEETAHAVRAGGRLPSEY